MKSNSFFNKDLAANALHSLMRPHEYALDHFFTLSESLRNSQEEKFVEHGDALEIYSDFHKKLVGYV